MYMSVLIQALHPAKKLIQQRGQSYSECFISRWAFIKVRFICIKEVHSLIYVVK